MRKGVTPVVATVLLMTITLAAAATLYTILQDQQTNTQNQINTDLNLNSDQLRIEQCYNQSTETYLVLRNNGQSAINTSEITPLLNGTPERNYQTNPEITGPQETFTINFSDQFGPDTQILLTSGRGNPVEYSCYQLT